MSATELLTLKCIPVNQPIGVFYIGAMNADELVAISWTDVRRIAPNEGRFVRDLDEPESPPNILESEQLALTIEDIDEDAVLVEDQHFEQFLGIQRALSPGRVAEITQYVGNVDATFPTAVLLSVSSAHARFNEISGELQLVRHSKVAKVIDGQHRIAGLAERGGGEFQVNVAIFIDMDIQDQAMVFATINLKQTKVNKSLAYDLYEFTTSRSPQRTCHEIARLLNYRRNSPFEGRIKMLGVGRWPTETITQATFVDRLLRLISRNPMEDRDLIRRGKRLPLEKGTRAQRQIFRNLFIRNRDDLIVVILWNFFLAVSKKWPDSWQTVERGNVLNRTTGFGALMRFMRIAYLSIESPSQVITSDKYQPLFDRMELADGSFKPDVYLPGSSGEKRLFDQLVKQSGLV